MSDEKRVFMDTSSGRVCEFWGGDAELSQDQLDMKKRKGKARLRIGGLVRFAEANACIVYFLTLTQAKADNSPRRLNKFMNFVRARYRAAGMPFKYAWVDEPQEQRYEETGVMAKHWHLVIAAPVGSLPNVEFIEEAPRGQKYHMISDGRVIKQNELYKRWGYGQELCQVARGSVWSYVSKYLELNLKEYGNMGRRFGSSMLTWWCISLWAFGCVHEFWLAGFDVIRTWFTHENDRRVLNMRVTDGRIMEFYKVPSPWVQMEQ